MSNQIRSAALILQALFQRLAVGVFALAALTSFLSIAMALTGQWSWLEFTVTAGDTAHPQAGMITQIGLGVLMFLLCFFLPGNARIMRLETSHRRFHIGMQDVAQAYATAHSADRNGLFQLSSEFDAVRERLAYLRDHPDLSTLEPSLLEIAAQMSHISHELADTYSDEKVTRARTFLTQRQEEVEAFNDRLDTAKSVIQELRHWSHEVDLEESVAVSQMQRLKDNLRDIMPEFGTDYMVKPKGTVVDITTHAAE